MTLPLSFLFYGLSTLLNECTFQALVVVTYADIQANKAGCPNQSPSFDTSNEQNGHLAQPPPQNLRFWHKWPSPSIGTVYDPVDLPPIGNNGYIHGAEYEAAQGSRTYISAAVILGNSKNSTDWSDRPSTPNQP